MLEQKILISKWYHGLDHIIMQLYASVDITSKVPNHNYTITHLILCVWVAKLLVVLGGGGFFWVMWQTILLASTGPRRAHRSLRKLLPLFGGKPEVCLQKLEMAF